MLIDSHAHLDMKDFKKDFGDVLKRALHEGVSHNLQVPTDLASLDRAVGRGQLGFTTDTERRNPSDFVVTLRRPPTRSTLTLA